MQSLVISQTNAQRLADALNVSGLATTASFDEVIAACHAPFNALADDAARHALLQSVFPTGYDDTISVTDLLDKLTMDVADTAIHGATGNQIAFTVKDQNLVRTVAYKRNSPERKPLTISISNMYATKVPVGANGGAFVAGKNADGSDKVDHLNGDPNRVVMIKGYTEDGDIIEIPTNLRFVRGEKGQRLFGEFHASGDAKHMPKALVNEDGTFNAESDFVCTVVGWAISAKEGHTYLQTNSAALTAAQKAISENKIKSDCIVEVTQNGAKKKAVILKYESETQFKFNTWGDRLVGTLKSIFTKKLDASLAADAAFKLTKGNELKGLLADADFYEKNSEKLEKGTLAKDALALKRFQAAVKGGMNEELAAKTYLE